MTLFNPVDNDLVRYLIGDTDSETFIGPDSTPESVIAVPFNPHQIFIGAMIESSDLHPLANGVQASLKKIGGRTNPKWLRDEWRVEINSLGATRTLYREAETLISEIVHTLVGSKTLYIGDTAYVHITSTVLPRFVGYLEGSLPLFNSTIDFVAEGLTDKYNRKALC